MKERLERFFFAPASEKPLMVLRLALTGLLFAQALSIAHLSLELWSSAGLMQTSLGDYLTGGDVMWFSGLRTLIRVLGIPEALWIRFLFAAYVGSLVALACVGRRAFAVAACLLHSLLLAGGSLSSYGVDQFAQLALFILILCPAPWPARASEGGRFALRTLQATLMLAYLGSGLAKARGTDWYTGDAIYRALTMPLYYTIDASFLIQHVWLAKLLSWGTLVLEIGYPVLMAYPRTRMLGVVGIVGMHAGIGIFMRLEFFAVLMALLTICAFGIDAENMAGSQQTRL